ncbi:unnamed protein product [Rotaria magnacalcarata]|uniref:Chitin synthase n=1 Tax=Rotaria magnacalcarata TaxID=392030 RepID=A0A814GZ53_9BILA|nr:unnamed protein product [Rotaria magnacalcarata]CAF1287292.1 unnamed protein product [Rotaria magnacalcarata]CAF2037438.1 unnamed protein product [Rotaria magnacalcarata]CAF3761572.1 unnamed protein product [Rotaria magnacalcarata]CAF3884916.1 unnamed protein product [Rotaria magnacalcarata]
MVKVDNRLINVITDYGTMPHQDDLIHTTVQPLGTDRRLTHLFLFYILRTIMVDSAVCYTKPPQSWYRLLTQRRRWGSNAFFNTIMNVYRSSIHPITRISSCRYLMKMCLVFFRLFNMGLFLTQLVAHFDLKGFLTQTGILLYPSCYFFLFSIFKKTVRSSLHKVLIGCLANRYISGLISVGIMATVFYNIVNFAWVPAASAKIKQEQSPEIYIFPTSEIPDADLQIFIAPLDSREESVPTM